MPAACALRTMRAGAAVHKQRVQAPVRCQAAATSVSVHPSGAHGGLRPAVSSPTANLAFELLQGHAARMANPSSVPTALLVHGILGSRRNLHSFARMIVEGFPSWQVVLVDLRCHGDSAAAAGAAPAPGPHTVDSAAADLLSLLRQGRMFPHMLVGHSFGGKVVMSMARQFGAAALPRPVQVWVLDAPPGEARMAGGGAGGEAAPDHPGDLISELRRVPLPLLSRAELVDRLTARGFSLPVARWMTTNLRAAGGGGLEWAFDLDGISEMYRSYESSALWDLLRAPPMGLRVDFVKATRSAFPWGAEVRPAVESLGHRVHDLDAGHWVHTDNPGGLFNIMAPSFAAADIHQQSLYHGSLQSSR